MRQKVMIISVLFLVIYSIHLTSSVAAQDIPQIQIVWRSGTAIGVLVASNTTSDQFKYLIYMFKKAKSESSLSKYVPSTTPDILGDPYQKVMIFVFSDSQWATEAENKKYLRASMTSQGGRVIAQMYLNHIKACYKWDKFEGKEYGSLGCDEGGIRSAFYKKLF